MNQTSSKQAENTIKVNGLDVAYRFDGPENGHVILIANSLMSDLSMWDWNVSALADRYRVLRYDKRGHGGSQTTPAPYSIPQLADDAVALLDALKIDKVHFIGLSMGGMIGQQLGARYPERVYSLSLCDTASEMPPRNLWEERFEIARKDGIPGLVDGTIKRWFTAPFIERAPQDIAKVRQMILGTGVEGYIGCASAVRDMAVATLWHLVINPGFLNFGELTTFLKTFNRFNFLAFCGRHWQRAATDCLTFKQNSTGATLTHTTAILGAS